MLTTFQATPLREYPQPMNVNLLTKFQYLADSAPEITLRYENAFHFFPLAYTDPDFDG